MTLDQAVEAAMQLSLEQREMLLSILRGRQIEARRNEIALDAQESLTMFRAGELQLMTAEEVLNELFETIEGEE